MASVRTRHQGSRALAAALVALALLGVPAAPPAAALRTQAIPVPVTGPDPALTKDLDAVAAVSPADTCLSVSIDGVGVYDRRADDPQVPASTEKVLTAAAALDLLGADRTYETKVVTTGSISGGVLHGDLVLIGVGDPGLVTSIYQAVRHTPDDQPTTLIDPLADRLVAMGIRAVDGRVLGDAQRYDSNYVVPSWPDRYAAQDQSGPISALAVDDAFLLKPDEDGKLDRVRSEAPAADAALAFAAVLASKGVVVGGGTGAGAAPAGARTLGSVTSHPLSDIVSDMLHRSDNQTAELLTKELGVVKGDGGSTAAGARVIAQWAAAHQAAAAGSVVVDGSGLDPGNRATCHELVRTLAASGGRGGTLAAGLSVAGESGTLGHRFRDTAANGVLRGKTGSLPSVTALTGFVDLPDGGTATFAYIANGAPVTAKVLKAQEFLAQILATYRPPCPDVTDLVSPVLPSTAQVGALAASAAAGPMPGLIVIADVLESSPADVLDRCSGADRKVHVALSPR